MSHPIYPTHACFDDCLDILEAFVLRDPKAAEECHVVHAICLMPSGKPYAHGWLERGDMAFFCGILDGEKVIVSCDMKEYREGLQIQQETRYTAYEAHLENKRTNHYGPWKEEYRALCGPSDTPNPTYTLIPGADGMAIRCNECGQVSHHPKDVEERYCGGCHLFLVEAA